ncbi:MAG: cell wall hydrolase/autolysin [Solirubrobacterales bacterium]|nr:cell wall hydrolase/autolysin [Solirubrobacterales bacterium]
MHVPRGLLIVVALAALYALVPTPALASTTSLAGKIVVLNPGHNGGNAAAPSQINRLVDIGQGQKKACDTTGTATNSGYSEASYNWDVAKRTRRVLRNRGATVILTRDNNTGVGPCIDMRAQIANRAKADATVSIHADGSAAGNRGFHVIEPTLITGLTDDIFSTSHRLAVDLRDAFTAATKQPFANYIANDGLARRGDLGGLRLADVPSVFIECGNMRDAKDAAQFKSSAWRLKAARGIANGIERFLKRT